ncbi:chaperone modulator CbpM [Lysobacter sp. FW306-1B-D06B]|uniref:chaperone modulator CbpM n=1 Tax=Lysobacter sp. FW306-1B-D06B TaxID=3140250 RepID=UPI003140583A
MTISLEEFLFATGIAAPTLDRWIDNQWISPVTTPRGMQFESVDLARATFVRELIQDLGVNEQGVDLVLDLVDQIHGLRSVLLSIRREAVFTNRSRLELPGPTS